MGGLDAYHWLTEALDTIERAHWKRGMKQVTSRSGAVVEIGAQNVLNFASNDYLGLASDDRLVQAATRAMQDYGVGATGSRLLSGHRALHRKLEIGLARWKRTEEALVFSSGYGACLGTVVALVGDRDVIFQDQYNHSCLQQGAKLSQAKLYSYKHNNIQHLQELLQQHRSQHRRCLIATETLFSMDGDCCPLPEVLDLAQQYNSMVLVDEAHANGVFGQNGAGWVQATDCQGRPLIQAGNLSKALGSMGGYVAGSSVLIEYLRHRAPTWMYSTGLSIPDTAAAAMAVAIVQGEPQRQAQLWRNVHDLRERLNQAELPLLSSVASPIICLPVRDAATAQELEPALLQAGVFAAVVRPPTVPTSRLRLSVMSTHTPDHLGELVAILSDFRDGLA
ncbi:8-amino-7-oxononanoate synthase [Gloeomargarita lithophora Alchichica-D10]|uniref:8-amino-7-oxononanoate synthase n=1 Tax=Gloeomargarita lithophora Alchichica-D10 TaxID=1188229 RepID=A0A1J0A9U9_9CYAN|nr:8-amino-7-oxononanoate synthase [Gloeomargarita lithophora]APB32714.1 8-amino-7-oxononanoate synthase [Gloeomargarita lithophora Alchichica-D10]